MGQLRNSNKSAFNVRDLHAFCKVRFDQVGDCKEIGNCFAPCPGQVTDFLAECNTSTFQESGDNGIVFAKCELPQERGLVSGLVTEKKDVHC